MTFNITKKAKSLSTFSTNNIVESVIKLNSEIKNICQFNTLSNNTMSFHTISQNSVTIKSTDSTKKSTTATEQLNSTAKVFCEACNQIVKAYLANYHETNMFQTINLSFAQKVIKKTKISFSQLVVTLVYLNRYYQSCTLFKKHIPGHEEAVIPSLSHVVLLCIIQAERYITDIPHKLSWWAGICAGQTKSSDINKWQRDFFNTINYKLYVHPEKDFNIFKVEVKRLAARLFSNSVVMPPQFRRSVCVGSQITPTSAPSSQIQQLPSQPNIVSTSSSNSTTTTTNVQPRILLSPLYSGNSNTNQQPQTAILSSQTNMLTSPLASVHSDNSVGPSVQTHQSQNLGVPVLNITNTNLTTSPVELSDNSIINQTRSPNSIYNNSLPNDTHPINITTSPLPPVQNPNRLMVQTNVRSPVRNLSTSSNSLLVLTNNNAPSKSTASPSSVQYGGKLTSSPVTSQNLVDSPLDMVKKEEIIESAKTLTPRPIKRKRSYYDHFPASMAANFLKATQSIKRTKMAMTISPEELNFQPHTPNSRPIEENNKKENNSSFQLINKNLVVSPQIQIHRPSEDNANQKNFPGEGHSFPYIDKGKYEEISSSESDSSSHPFRITEKSMTSNVENPFLNSIETIPNSNIKDVMDPLDNNVAASSEEIIASSLLLAANNSTLIPVSPPYTPK